MPVNWLIGSEGDVIGNLLKSSFALYKAAFTELLDASIVEINPMIASPIKRSIGTDAKMNF